MDDGEGRDGAGQHDVEPPPPGPGIGLLGGDRRGFHDADLVVDVR